MGKNDKKPLLIVLSGCSGVGKDAILARMKETGLPYFFAVTATSRPKRPGEIDGKDYHFIEKPRFEKMIEQGDFIEWANVYGNLYGVPRKSVEDAMKAGKDTIVKVDIQGARTIKKIVPEAVTIFVAPPSLEELERRLRERKTESSDDLELRLSTAQRELEDMNSFDYVVISHNNSIDQAIAEITAIIDKEKSRIES